MPHIGAVTIDLAHRQRVPVRIYVIGQHAVSRHCQGRVFIGDIAVVVSVGGIITGIRRVVHRRNLHRDRGTSRGTIAVVDGVLERGVAVEVVVRGKGDGAVAVQYHTAVGGIANTGDGEGVTVRVIVVSQQRAGLDGQRGVFFGGQRVIAGSGGVVVVFRHRGVVHRRDRNRKGRRNGVFSVCYVVASGFDIAVIVLDRSKCERAILGNGQGAHTILSGRLTCSCSLFVPAETHYRGRIGAIWVLGIVEYVAASHLVFVGRNRLTVISEGIDRLGSRLWLRRRLNLLGSCRIRSPAKLNELSFFQPARGLKT